MNTLIRYILLACFVFTATCSCKSTAISRGTPKTALQSTQGMHSNSNPNVVNGTNSIPNRNSAAMAYKLMHKTWCSNDDAFSMVLLLFTGQDRCKDFAQRLALLKQQGLADKSWHLNADKTVTKGTLAYMLCKGLKIKGGVVMHLLDIRRYAYREAVYNKLMQPGSEYEPLTGPEVVGIMNRAGNYKQRGTL